MSVFYLARGEACPHRLRIYSNRPHGIDFDEAESTKPHLDMSLLENEHGVTEYPLRVAAFANVNSLTLFFVRGFCNVHITQLFVSLAFYKSATLFCFFPISSSPTYTISLNLQRKSHHGYIILGSEATLVKLGKKCPQNSISPPLMPLMHLSPK